MNIQAFSMVSAAYMNPTAYGDLQGANYAVWLAGHLLADLKFMSIFSMLFGAGIFLMTSHIEASGQRPTRLHYRRMGWLMLGCCMGRFCGTAISFTTMRFVECLCICSASGGRAP